MNWREIDENWKSFCKEYNCESERRENNYFYGYKDIYEAKENFQGFEIIYENKINKSISQSSSDRIGHAMRVCSAIKVEPKTWLTISKNSLWQKLFGTKGDLNIESSEAGIKDNLPLKEIEELISLFPDLQISIKKFDRHRNGYFQIGQEVLLIETKCQPEELEHLKMFRKVMISIILELNKTKFILNTSP